MLLRSTFLSFTEKTSLIASGKSQGLTQINPISVVLAGAVRWKGGVGYFEFHPFKLKQKLLGLQNLAYPAFNDLIQNVFTFSAIKKQIYSNIM